MRGLIRGYLPSSVRQVYECCDGNEAYTFFKKFLPDWVLMDLEMPNTNGIDAIKNIIAEFPKAKICMVTASADEHIRVEAISKGAKGFVLKDNLFEIEGVLGAA